MLLCLIFGIPPVVSVLGNSLLLDEKYRRYIKSKDLKLYAVNVPLRRDTANQAFETINRLNYSFSVLIADSVEVKKFGVHSFPTVIVIDKQGYLIFRGRLEDVDDVLKGVIK